MIYRQTGPADVIRAEEIDVPRPGPGEVLVKIAVSGVNPTDWKSRQGYAGPGQPPEPAGWQVPNQDGSGLVVAVGEGVPPVLLHERVWIWESAKARPHGTAAEYATVPQKQVVLLGEKPSYELGAALGVPFLTAHRCLTVGENMPDRLGPGALAGRTILVQGGAGAVGNAAIQLARWADATVVATVSSPAKAQLAAAAGADHVIDYKTQDVVREVRKIIPHGVDVVVEVDVANNASIDADVLALHGTVAVYAATPDQSTTIPIRTQMTLNTQWHFVLLYSVPARPKGYAVEDVAAAVVDDAVGVGHDHGLPLHRYALEDTAAAHAAVEGGAVGKVLITVDEAPKP